MMMISRALAGLLFFLNLNSTLAWDGCDYDTAWRCGDKCINGWPGLEAECRCGGVTFNHTAQMWCCNDVPCSGRRKSSHSDTWLGEKDEEGRLIGAECSGTPIKLTESCNETCNGDVKDSSRNRYGVMRSYVPCNVTNVKIKQCI